MSKKIGLFWLREDFRIKKNFGLYEATKNHDEVVVFYLYKEPMYQKQEAQKWWLSKSLLNFKKKLSDFNINLEIIKTESFKIFFDKLINKKDFSIYWNKVYEPGYLNFDKYLSKNLKIKNISFKIFKGDLAYISEQSGRVVGGFRLYPNPTSEHLYVESYTKVSTDQIKVYTVDGKEVTPSSKNIIKDDALSQIIRLGVRRLKRGTYVVVTNGSSKVFVKE